jgi:hypothetical protein
MGEQFDQGGDVVAADHGGQQLHRLHGRHQGAGGLPWATALSQSL